MMIRNILISIHVIGNNTTEEQFVSVRGGALYCKAFGEGKPMIALHGGPGMTLDSLLPQMERLAHQRRVIFFDQRGCGRTTAPLENPKDVMETLVEDLEAVRIAFGCGRFSLLGHSWGGLYAMHYAVTHPENLDALILADAVPSTSEGFSQFVREGFRRLRPHQKRLKELLHSPEFLECDPAAVSAYQRLIFSTYFYNPELVEGLNLNLDGESAQKYLKTFAFMREHVLFKEFDLGPLLQKVHCRALVIHGDSEPFPVASAEETHRLLPDAEFVLLRECGHFPYVEKPEPFFAAIDRFLRL